MPQIKKVELTRTRATEYLANTTIHRPISDSVVEKYKHDMNTGQWKGDICPPLVIGQNGGLADGNHRCTAFLASDLETLSTWVLVTDDPDAVLVLDTGRPRSLRDQLELRGHPHGKELQALFNTSWKWKGGDLGPVGTMSRWDQVRWIESNPNASKAAAAAYQTSVTPSSGLVIRFPIGTVGCLYDVACYGEGGDIVEEFIGGASHGSITFPILSRLQQKLADHSNPRNSFRMSPTQLSFNVVRVYLAWLNEETHLDKLYGSRRILSDLPGWYDWLHAMWPERTTKKEGK